MLQAIKQFLRTFQKEEVLAVEVPSINLQLWLQQEIQKISYDQYLNDYFAKIKRIKERLPPKILLLEKAEIAREHQNAESRIKNIVLGHRQHYTQEISRFQESLEPLDLDWRMVGNIQQAFSFNQNLDSQLEELAKRTAKSYQASQHLFFKEVEAIFREIGEINLLVKEFWETLRLWPSLMAIQEMIEQLSASLSQQEKFTAELQQKHEELHILQLAVDEKEKELAGFVQGSEFQQLKATEEKITRVQQKIQEEEKAIFTFFSKLSKPLRRYQRVALNSRGITPYVDNAITAFYDDHNLAIIEGLRGLQKNIASLRFDEKQQSQILDMIQQAENGYLQEIQTRIQHFNAEEKQLQGTLKESIRHKKKLLEKDVLHFQNQAESKEKEIRDGEKALARNDFTLQKEEIQKAVKETVGIILKIT